MAYSFDYENKFINVIAPQIDVDIYDLYLAIRLQETTETGIQYDEIVYASGKETLTTGVLVGITMELLGWQLKFWEGEYTATVSGGNLTGGIGGKAVANTPGVNVQIIQSAASTIVQVSTGSGLSAEQDEKLMSLPSASEVWAEDNAGNKLTFTAAMQAGKWTIIGNQMVFFDSDNITEIARFNLFDADGNPSMENVFTRERV